MLQQAWRGRAGRKQVLLLKALREADRAARARELAAAGHLQVVVEFTWRIRIASLHN